MPERSTDWMEQSKRDLQMAGQAAASGFPEWACFIAQQAAEKAIKAVYQRKGGVAWGHSGRPVAGSSRQLQGPIGPLKGGTEPRPVVYPGTVS